MRLSIKELTIENTPQDLGRLAKTLFPSAQRAATPEGTQKVTPQGIAKVDAPVVVKGSADIDRIAEKAFEHVVNALQEMASCTTSNKAKTANAATKAGGAVSESDTGEKSDAADEHISISRRDLYCIARLLKSANYALTTAGVGGLFDDCEKCRFQCNTADNYDSICKILARETGITLFAPHDWPEKWPPRGAMA